MSDEKKPRARSNRRQSAGQSQQVSFRLNPATIKELDRVADERMVSASLIVDRAIVKFLADLAPVNEELFEREPVRFDQVG